MFQFASAKDALLNSGGVPLITKVISLRKLRRHEQMMIVECDENINSIC